jgi:subtilisin family serine protease
MAPQAVWAAEDTYRERQDWIDQLGVSAAWDAGLDGSGVIVAVIDSGLASEHEDLTSDRVLPGRNYTGIGSAYSTTDRTGHGTFICGMLAARRDNGLGIAGLVDGVSLLPIKCF